MDSWNTIVSFWVNGLFSGAKMLVSGRDPFIIDAKKELLNPLENRQDFRSHFFFGDSMRFSKKNGSLVQESAMNSVIIIQGGPPSTYKWGYNSYK